MYFDPKESRWKEGPEPTTTISPVYGEEGLKGTKTIEKYPSGVVKIIETPKEVITSEGISYYPSPEIKTTTITPIQTTETALGQSKISIFQRMVEQPFSPEFAKVQEEKSRWEEISPITLEMTKRIEETGPLIGKTDIGSQIIRGLAYTGVGIIGTAETVIRSPVWMPKAHGEMVEYGKEYGVKGLFTQAIVGGGMLISSEIKYVKERPIEFGTSLITSLALGYSIKKGIEMIQWKISKPTTVFGEKVVSIEAGKAEVIGGAITELKGKRYPSIYKTYSIVSPEEGGISRGYGASLIWTKGGKEDIGTIAATKFITKEIGADLTAQVSMSKYVSGIGRKTIEGMEAGRFLIKSVSPELSISLGETLSEKGVHGIIGGVTKKISDVFYPSYDFTPSSSIVTKTSNIGDIIGKTIKQSVKPPISPSIKSIIPTSVISTTPLLQKKETYIRALKEEKITLQPTIQVQKQELSTIQFPATKTISLTKQIQSSVRGQSSIMRQIQTPIQKQTQIQGISQIQSQLQKQTPIQQQMQKTATTTSMLTPTITIPKTSFILPPFDLKLPSSFGESLGIRMPRGKQKKKYRPSLYGIMSGIKIPKTSGFSLGIEPRYPISFRKRHRKRRR